MVRIIHILWVLLAAISMPETTIHLSESSAFSQNLSSQHSSSTHIATTVQTISPFSWEESREAWAEEYEETEETKKPRKLLLLNWYTRLTQSFSPQVYLHQLHNKPGSNLQLIPADCTTLHGVMLI